MWSPSGAVGRGVLDNTCWPALSPLGADVTLGPKQWHKPSLGCSSCPQPNPEPLLWVPILASGILPLPRTEGREKEGFFPLQNCVLFGILQFLSGQERGSVVEARLQNVRCSQHLPQGPALCSLWLPPQPGYPGYPGVAFTAAQKSQVGLCDQNTQHKGGAGLQQHGGRAQGSVWGWCEVWVRGRH